MYLWVDGSAGVSKEADGYVVFSLCSSFFFLHAYDCLGESFELFACVFYCGDVCSVGDSALPLMVGGIWCRLCEEIVECIFCECLNGVFGFGFVLFEGK